MAITITGATPASPTGYSTGGAVVTLTGTNLDTAVGVYVGPYPATIISKAPTSLKFKAGPGTGSTLPIRVLDNTTEVVATPTFTYSAAPASETLVTSLARKFRLDVTPDAGTTWVKFRGITTIQNVVTPTLQDDSDIDSNGWGSDAKTMNKWAVTFTCKRGIGVTTGNYDPGQELVRACQDQFGVAGVVNIRWYDRNGGPEAYQGIAQVSWSPNGGGADALDTVAVTLTGQGARVLITNPVLADASLAA